jgi:CRP-like cAMP-binding protein
MCSARSQPFPLFQRFPALLPLVQQHTHRKDDILAHHGAAADTVWLVLSGWASLLRHTPGGTQVTMDLCSTGDLLGEDALNGQPHYTHSIRVLENGTQLAALPARALQALTASDSALSTALMGLLSARLNRVQRQLEQRTSLSAPQRLGCFLLRLREQQGGTGPLHLPLDKQVIASYLGMKPETLSRSFQQLQPHGISVAQAQVGVASLGALRAYVCGSCGESGLCPTEQARACSAPAG